MSEYIGWCYSMKGGEVDGVYSMRFNVQPQAAVEL